MMSNQIAIIGCGDVGLRIAKLLQKNDVRDCLVIPTVRSQESQSALLPLFENTQVLDLDERQVSDYSWLSHVTEIYYLVPPQKTGLKDQRSQRLISILKQQKIALKRIILISTTGVYGDCQGEVVSESKSLNPTTPRSQRRADLERQWTEYAEQHNSILSVFRVPGIYSFSRLPRARLEAKKPIVDPAECGFTNRIHADDLAMVCNHVMKHQTQTDVYNVSDGNPGKMSEYFLEVAKFLGIPTPEVVSLSQAEKIVTSDMLSYLKESRKISNEKLLSTFQLELSYPDYRQGIKV